MSNDLPDPGQNAESLRSRLARALEEADPSLRDRLEVDSAAHLELIALARAARAESEALELAAVQSARQAGCTWEQIGAILGMTKQAAQQHFGKGLNPEIGADNVANQPNRRVLRPLSAFNEMAVLGRAGLYGWHSVGYGPLRHLVERDHRQWEHQRKSLGTAPSGSGWRRVGSGWGWWNYWARPLDRPAIEDPTAEADLPWA
ncbi:MAG: hypothetical protein LBU05_01955 [Bifidobacteriaceae bacterium]|jgi:hypothetical protein|nr:hypothetical protein [Bifidobacteriaceae bacterium]